MERYELRLAFRPFLLTVFATLFNLAVFAQTDAGSGGSESSSTTTTTKTSTSTTSGDWYTSPWVWVVGAAVFILLLVALLSNRGRDSVSTTRVTKTVERDSGSGA